MMDGHEQQLELDFERRDQKQIIDWCQLPSVMCRDGKTVSGATIKTVLRVIDNFAGRHGTCYAGKTLMSKKTQLGQRSIVRSWEALRRLGITTVQRVNKNGRWTIHRRIVFARLMEFVDDADRPQKNSAAGSDPASGVTSASGPASGAASPSDLASGVDQTDDSARGVSATRDRVSATRGKSQCHRGYDNPTGTRQDPPPPPRDGPTGVAGDEWGAVAAEMRALGVRWPQTALKPARASGASPAEIRRGIEYFRASAARYGWSAGALHRWVREWTAGGDLADHWPEARHRTGPPTDDAARIAAIARSLKSCDSEQLAELVDQHFAGDAFRTARSNFAQHGVVDLNLLARLMLRAGAVPPITTLNPWTPS